MKQEYDAYNVQKTAYNTQLLAYNTLKDQYNLALKEETQRVADVFRSMITPPTSIPDRPCKPDQIAAYDGPKMVWSTATTAFAAWTSTIKGEKSAILTENSSVDNVIGSFKQGYIQTSIDTSIDPQTATQRENVYHTYGLLGQGVEVDPFNTTNKAFQWKTTTSTATHSMMFSLLPYDYTDTGLTGSNKVQVNSTIVAFDARTDVIYPTQPVAGIDPDAAAGAKAFAVLSGIAGSLSFASSLF